MPRSRMKGLHFGEFSMETFMIVLFAIFDLVLIVSYT